jgi:hypothetical protein
MTFLENDLSNAHHQINVLNKYQRVRCTDLDKGLDYYTKDSLIIIDGITFACEKRQHDNHNKLYYIDHR